MLNKSVMEITINIIQKASIFFRGGQGLIRKIFTIIDKCTTRVSAPFYHRHVVNPLSPESDQH